ncbi:MAG: Gfo/Idh/MocA family oxidoreductase, partial [Gammaproteobacteria bacterium]|nr:Gfo/Idh/MocA family oxidoreductase [Gammaproteobacteria bacterium]NNM12698.1 Gfo/Idh/MocA family oxidoreductase [Gammaproteobacteria bacterium]
DVDAIYIATPHNFHLEQSLQAINAGKSVLCEKPLTVNAAECESLIEAARNSNVSVMEGMWTYFLPAMQQSKTWLDDGRIGKLVHIKADFGFKMPFNAQGRLYNPDLAGGSLLDVGIYPIALTWLFAQALPAKIDVVSRFAETGVDDDLAMLLSFRDFTASLSCSFRATLPNRAFVVGDEGYIELPDFWSARQCKLFTADKLIDEFDDARQGSGFEFQIESFSQDILHKRKESRIMPLSTSLALQTIMHAVRKEF